MRNAVSFSLIVTTLLLISSCGDDDKTSTPPLIDPADANALSAALTMVAGAESRTGNPPASSGGTSGAATVVALTSSTTSSNGRVATPVVFNYEGGSDNLAGVYVQVGGANTYYEIPLSGPTAGQITIPIGLPTNLDEGTFILEYRVFDVNDLISNVGELTVDVLKLGTGALQISLSWNTATDQDLYVVDPNGFEISYNNTVSESGGELDHDNTSGYGPENIFWETDAPDGSYSVSVNDYDATGVSSTCFVTISAPGKSKTFTVTTQNGSTANVVSFTKSGSTYSF